MTFRTILCFLPLVLIDVAIFVHAAELYLRSQLRAGKVREKWSPEAAARDNRDAP
jgi:hypothetical protein